MTIDEVIAEMKNNADRFKKLSEDYGDSFRHMEVLSDLENAVFYEKQEAKYRQIAAWLEELRVRRNSDKLGCKDSINVYMQELKTMLKHLENERRISRVEYEALVEKLKGHDRQIYKKAVEDCACVVSRIIDCRYCPIVCGVHTVGQCEKAVKVYLQEHLEGGE